MQFLGTPTVTLHRGPYVVGNPRGCGCHGIGLQVRIPLRCARLSVAQHLADDWQSHPTRRGDAREAVPQVVQAHVFDPGCSTDATPRLLDKGRAALRSKNVGFAEHARQASQHRKSRWRQDKVFAPVLLSGSLAVPLSMSIQPHRRLSTSPSRAPVNTKPDCRRGKG